VVELEIPQTEELNWDETIRDCTFNTKEIELDSGVVNFVEWHPNNAKWLLVSSFAPEIFLYDISNPETPLYTYSGHVSERVSRCTQLSRPVFTPDGNSVIVCGEKSKSLSVFQTQKPGKFSQAVTGFDASTLSVFDTKLYAASRKQILVYDLH
jgi:WD40 repeat protein